MKVNRETSAGMGLVAFLLLLPLVGIIVGRKPIRDYVQFPPLTRYVEHAGFSWPVFIGLLVFVLVAVVPFLVRVIRSQGSVDRMSPTNRPFPAWGWGGVFLLAVAWLVAWTRLPLFESVQAFTFTPLWLTVTGQRLPEHCRCPSR